MPPPKPKGETIPLNLLPIQNERVNRSQAHCLDVAFPIKEKNHVFTLGGMLKLKKSHQDGVLRGVLVLSSPEDADRILEMEHPAAVSIIRCRNAILATEVCPYSLKIHNLPTDATIADVAKFLPTAETIIMKNPKYTGWYGDSHHRRAGEHIVKKEAVVRFSSPSECHESFLAREVLPIRGAECVVTFGVNNFGKKIRKEKRIKQRTINWKKGKNRNRECQK